LFAKNYHQQISLSAEYKLFGNWRQMYQSNSEPFCAGMNNSEAGVAKVAEMFAPTMQGILHKCPYRSGSYRIANYTDPFIAQMDKLDKEGKNVAELGAIFKGDMRLKLKIITANDPNVLDFMIAYTLKFRQGNAF